MPTHLLIGAGAGLVSAALYASAATAAPLAILLFYLSPLPLCLAGLGWGRAAVALAAVVGTVVVAVTLGPGTGLAYGLVIAAPVAMLIRLILLSRPVPARKGETSPGLEWYPVGRLVGWAALMASALAVLLILILGPGAESYQQSVDKMLPFILKALDPDGSVFTPDTMDTVKAAFAKAIPAAFAIVWLSATLLNLWLAGLIVEASGRSLRPWPDLHGIELPNVYVAIFAAAFLASFLPGIVGLIGTGVTGAMLFAFALQGLAVIHVYSLGMPFRTFLLAVVYLGILLLGWVAILVAILGLGEPVFGLRARSATSAQPPQQNDETD